MRYDYSDRFDQMYDASGLGDLFGSMSERKAAAKGICPTYRVCQDREDLAGWFKSVGIAAGAIVKARNSGNIHSA